MPRRAWKYLGLRGAPGAIGYITPKGGVKQLRGTWPQAWLVAGTFSSLGLGKPEG